jgi:large conductance mechanosensitive channel
MRNLIREYKEFINKGDVVLVAVALVMALYFKAIVDQLIAAVVSPLIALIFNADSIEQIDFTISGTVFPIGLVIKAIIDFVAVAIILFFVVKAYNSWKQPQLTSQRGRRAAQHPIRFNGAPCQHDRHVPRRARREPRSWPSAPRCWSSRAVRARQHRPRRCPGRSVVSVRCPIP